MEVSELSLEMLTFVKTVETDDSVVHVFCENLEESELCVVSDEPDGNSWCCNQGNVR